MVKCAPLKTKYILKENTMTYTDLTPGTAFMYEGNPWIVISGEFHRMQMRKAVMRCAMKNLISGQLVQKTFTASDKFDPANVEKISAQYLYKDAESYHFMDKETFEQYHGTEADLGEKVKFLSENLELSVMLYNHKPVQILLPKNATLKVIDSPQAIKGDSVSNTFKTVTLENGMKVSVPLFIQEGEMLRIDTETEKYIERA
jgi:elongation factor P